MRLLLVHLRFPRTIFHRSRFNDEEKEHRQRTVQISLCIFQPFSILLLVVAILFTEKRIKIQSISCLQSMSRVTEKQPTTVVLILEVRHTNCRKGRACSASVALLPFECIPAPYLTLCAKRKIEQ